MTNQENNQAATAEKFVLITCDGSSYQPYKADGAAKEEKITRKMACISLADNHIGFMTIGNKSKKLTELPDGHATFEDFAKSDAGKDLGIRKSKKNDWYSNGAKLTNRQTLTIQNDLHPERVLGELLEKFNEVFAGKVEPYATAEVTGEHEDKAPQYSKDAFLEFNGEGVTLVWDNTQSRTDGWRKRILIAPQQFTDAIATLIGNSTDSEDISEVCTEDEIPELVRSFNRDNAAANRSQGRRAQGTNITDF